MNRAWLLSLLMIPILSMVGQEAAPASFEHWSAASLKQIGQSFHERTKSLREQLRAKRQELRQANEGGTFNEALATQNLTESAGLQAKLMGEEFKLRQEMLTVLTPEQKTQLDQMRQQFKSDHGNFKGGRGRGERREAPKQ